MTVPGLKIDQSWSMVVLHQQNKTTDIRNQESKVIWLPRSRIGAAWQQVLRSLCLAGHLGHSVANTLDRSLDSC